MRKGHILTVPRDSLLLSWNLRLQTHEEVWRLFNRLRSRFSRYCRSILRKGGRLTFINNDTATTGMSMRNNPPDATSLNPIEKWKSGAVIPLAVCHHYVTRTSVLSSNWHEAHFNPDLDHNYFSIIFKFLSLYYGRLKITYGFKTIAPIRQPGEWIPRSSMLSAMPCFCTPRRRESTKSQFLGRGASSHQHDRRMTSTNMNLDPDKTGISRLRNWGSLVDKGP